MMMNRTVTILKKLSISELYAILVLKFRLDPEYVLDRMEMIEARTLIRYENYSNRDEWEQTRLIAYIIAQTNSTKRLKPDDILSFDWDSEKKEQTIKPVTDKDIKMLKEQAKKLKELI